MARFEHGTFENTTVDLDGNQFKDCIFVRCQLRYGGGPPFSLVNCKFEHCGFAFRGPAANTLTFLKAIYHGFGNWGEDTVNNVFEEIRRKEERKPDKSE